MIYLNLPINKTHVVSVAQKCSFISIDMIEIYAQFEELSYARAIIYMQICDDGNSLVTQQIISQVLCSAVLQQLTCKVWCTDCTFCQVSYS
jgi:hypothetical protein